MNIIDEVVARESNGLNYWPGKGLLFSKETFRAILQEVHDAAVAEAGRDAERYRWLRDIGDETWTPFVIHGMQTAKSVDAWIDAAIAAAKEK